MQIQQIRPGNSRSFNSNILKLVLQFKEMSLRQYLNTNRECYIKLKCFKVYLYTIQ